MAVESWLLKCNVSPGVWTNEFAVSCSTAGGQLLSFFVPQNMVQVKSTSSDSSKPVEGWIPVSILDTKGDVLLISLPSTPIESSSSRTVTVRSNQLVQAA